MNEVSLFKNISEKDLLTLLKCLNARKILFKKNATILSNMNNTNEIGVVTKGKVSLIRIDFNGTKSLVSHYYKNDVFGGCFTNYNNEELTVTAESDAEITFLDYDKILNRCQKNCYFHETLINNMTELLVQKINEINERVEILTKKTIRDKILEYFHLIERKKHTSEFLLDITFTKLADFLAVDRSALMREIKNLKDEKIIEVNNKKIKIIYR